MPKYVAVNRERHSAKRLRAHENFAFLAREAVVPIVSAELQAVALSMPIGFIEQSGRYSLVAVLSFVPGHNLFVGPDNQWLGKYLPAMFRAYPFRLLRKEGSDESILGIDEESRLIVDANETGEAFYDSEGKPSASVQAMTNFLVGVERGRTATDLAVAALAKARVICPWAIKIKTGDGEKPVSGLHQIDEVALNALGDDSFLQLRKALALPIAYAQLISIGQTTALERLVILHENLRKAQKPKLPEEIVFDADTLNKVR
jgi:hypothetical protein